MRFLPGRVLGRGLLHGMEAFLPSGISLFEESDLVDGGVNQGLDRIDIVLDLRIV